jgi:sigma-B regulation protein RsbU (phosphoserine phosphatase)
MCRQAEAVGGDLYDFIRLPNDELGLTAGDVCGKGIGAALMMANPQATLRAEVRHVPADPGGSIRAANGLFYESSLERSIPLCFTPPSIPTTRVVKYVNAGRVEITESVEAFSRGIEHRDDMALVVLRAI